MPQTYPNPELLVETSWLADRLQRQDVRIVDMGPLQQYVRAHIPGAVHPGPADRSHYLKDPADPLHIMPPEQFAALMASLGIGDETLVVAYDADGGHTAARLWWALNYYGHDQVKLLNGGWNKWLLEKRQASMAIPKYKRASFTPRIREHLLATVDQLKASLRTHSFPTPEDGGPGLPAVYLDVRSAAEWAGIDHRGNKRAGRLPGAKHAEWRTFVTDDPAMTFRSPAELRSLLESISVTATKEVATYCQAGVRASHGAFTLALMGYPRVRVYDGSMEEWANRRDTPLENEQPGVAKVKRPTVARKTATRQK